VTHGAKQLVVNVLGTSYYGGDGAAAFIADASFRFDGSARRAATLV